MSRVISIIGRKGGVGKTTSTVHLASRIADKGFNVCVIDFDTTQSNATRNLIGPIWSENQSQKGICAAIYGDCNLDDVIVKTSRENLYMIPSEKVNERGQPYNIETYLASLELEGYQKLKILIEESQALSEMHFIFIDNAPNLGIATVGALMTSDYFLVPVQIGDYSMESIADTVNAALKVKKIGNPLLNPLGFFISSMDKRPKMAKMAMSELKELSNQTTIHLFKTIIPVSSKFNFLPRTMKTIFDVTRPNDRGHKEYLELADEMLERIKDIETNENKKQQQNQIRAEV